MSIFTAVHKGLTVFDSVIKKRKIQSENAVTIAFNKEHRKATDLINLMYPIVAELRFNFGQNHKPGELPNVDSFLQMPNINPDIIDDIYDFCEKGK